MRFGLNTFLYASPFTNESVYLFKKLKNWGFDSVEIPIEDPSHVDPKFLKAAAAKAGIAIGSTVGARLLDWQGLSVLGVAAGASAGLALVHLLVSDRLARRMPAATSAAA